MFLVWSRSMFPEAFESKRRTLMHFLWKCSTNFATVGETGFTIHGVKAHGHPFTWAWIHRDITFFSSGTSPFLASNLPCRHGKIFVEFPGRNMEYWSENAVIRGNDNCRCPVTGPMISCRFLHVWRMCLYPQVPYYLGHAFKSWVALGDLATRRFSPRLISKAN